MKRYIYLLRHGNPGDADTPTKCLGDTDVSISEYGKQQISKVKDFVTHFGWTKVYSSPLKRCLETAACLGIPENKLRIEDDLREMAAGIWENMTFHEIKETYPNLYRMRGECLGTFAVEGAESFVQVGKRFANCLERIRMETKEDILVISHAGVIRGFLCSLEGEDYNKVMHIPMPYAGITILEEENEKLRLLEVGVRPLELLDEEEIQTIYRKCKTPENIICHMKKVAETAAVFMEKNRELFSAHEIALVYKAALLHDILRIEKKHAEKSADFLRKEGYKEVADLVSLHHSSLITDSDNLELHEILFYIDKRVQEDELVSLEERFAKSYKKCNGIPAAEEKHQRLFEKAKGIEQKFLKLNY